MPYHGRTAPALRLSHARLRLRSGVRCDRRLPSGSSTSAAGAVLSATSVWRAALRLRIRGAVWAARAVRCLSRAAISAAAAVSGVDRAADVTTSAAARIRRLFRGGAAAMRRRDQRVPREGRRPAGRAPARQGGVLRRGRRGRRDARDDPRRERSLPEPGAKRVSRMAGASRPDDPILPREHVPGGAGRAVYGARALHQHDESRLHGPLLRLLRAAGRQDLGWCRTTSAERVVFAAGQVRFAAGQVRYALFRARSLRDACTAAATRRPSAIAHTTSDWPRETSPAAKTPAALVAPLGVGSHVAALASSASPSCATSPCGLRADEAHRQEHETRRGGTACSLRIAASSRPRARRERPRGASRAASSPRKARVETAQSRSAPSSCEAGRAQDERPLRPGVGRACARAAAWASARAA